MEKLSEITEKTLSASIDNKRKSFEKVEEREKKRRKISLVHPQSHNNTHRSNTISRGARALFFLSLSIL